MLIARKLIAQGTPSEVLIDKNLVRANELAKNWEEKVNMNKNQKLAKQIIG